MSSIKPDISKKLHRLLKSGKIALKERTVIKDPKAAVEKKEVTLEEKNIKAAEDRKAVDDGMARLNLR